MTLLILFKHFLDQPLVGMGGIEQGLDVDLAILPGSVGTDLQEASRQHLTIQGVFAYDCAVVEEQFRCDGLHRSV